MSDSFIEMLIAAVRKAKLLWDKTDKRYHNRLLIDKEWTRIAKELGETKETVKGKWKNLRDTFKKELKKVRVYKSGDQAEEGFRYTGSWCHFAAMQFLKRIATPREIEGNLLASQEGNIVGHVQESRRAESHHKHESKELQESEEQVEESEEEQMEISQHEETESVVPAKPLSSTRGKSQALRLQGELENFDKSLPAANSPTLPSQVTASRKRKSETSLNHENYFEREMLKLEAEKLALLQRTNDDDEDVNFFKSLLPHVRQLPPINKLILRTQIQNLLCQELIELQAPNRQHSNIGSQSSATDSSPCNSPPSSLYNIDQKSVFQNVDQYNNFIDEIN